MIRKGMIPCFSDDRCPGWNPFPCHNSIKRWNSSFSASRFNVEFNTFTGQRLRSDRSLCGDSKPRSMYCITLPFPNLLRGNRWFPLVFGWCANKTVLGTWRSGEEHSHPQFRSSFFRNWHHHKERIPACGTLRKHPTDCHYDSIWAPPFALRIFESSRNQCISLRKGMEALKTFETIKHDSHNKYCWQGMSTG